MGCVGPGRSRSSSPGMAEPLFLPKWHPLHDSECSRAPANPRPFDSSTPPSSVSEAIRTREAEQQLTITRSLCSRSTHGMRAAQCHSQRKANRHGKATGERTQHKMWEIWLPARAQQNQEALPPANLRKHLLHQRSPKRPFRKRNQVTNDHFA